MLAGHRPGNRERPSTDGQEQCRNTWNVARRTPGRGQFPGALPAAGRCCASEAAITHPATKASAIRCIFRADAVGSLPGSAGVSTGQKFNIADRPYFKHAMAGKTVMSDPVVSRRRQARRRRGGADHAQRKAIGVNGGAVSLDEVIKLVGKVKTGETGYAYVVQSDGMIIFHPDPNMVMKINALTSDTTPPTPKEISGRMAKGEQESGSANSTAAPNTSPSRPSRERAGVWRSMCRKARSRQARHPAMDDAGDALAVLAVAIGVSFYISATFTSAQRHEGMLQQIAQGGGDLTRRTDYPGWMRSQKPRIISIPSESLRVMFGEIRGEAAKLTAGVHDINGGAGDRFRRVPRSGRAEHEQRGDDRRGHRQHRAYCR